MFATMRRKRRNATMKHELGLGVEHFKRAASLAAQETSATMSPKLSAARDRMQPAAARALDTATNSWESAVATLTPLVAAANESMRQAGKEGSKNARKSMRRRKTRHAHRSMSRGSKLAGLALAGAAVGMGAAYLTRRRKAAQWDEYDPNRTIGATVESIGGADDAAFEPADPMASTSGNTPATPTDPVDQNGSGPRGPEVARTAGKNKS
ncbi:hypothetical protein [Krasilnikovia sp. MM14-A1259]|uniref:hypothetical protein n=1 Tax=Krasilnikovia sp. MM14-A1259 TaxID=3373539 RepID=UPI00382688E6